MTALSWWRRRLVRGRGGAPLRSHPLTPTPTPTSSFSDRAPIFGDEINDPRFVLELLPEAPAPVPTAPRFLTLADRDGRPFTCALPDADGGGARDGGADDADADADAPRPSTLVASLAGACVLRVEDWWTYEYCAGAHVRQFHGGEGGEAVDAFMLGRVNESRASSLDAVHLDASSPAGDARYVATTYDGGDPCDLTGEPRSVEVRFVCAEGGRDALHSVREPSTCAYVAVVGVAALCSHPGFRAREPPTAAIACWPKDGG